MFLWENLFQAAKLWCVHVGVLNDISMRSTVSTGQPHLIIQALLDLLQEALDMTDKGFWLKWDPKLLACLTRLVSATYYAAALLHIPRAHLHPYRHTLLHTPSNLNESQYVAL